MAKIDLSKFPKHLHTAITKALDETLTQDLLQKIGDDFAEQIRIRTRLGNGLNQNGGEPYKLRPLSKKYQNYRKNLPELSEFTKPTKSNLTLTGEMLEDLTATVSDDKITLTFKNQESKDKARWNQEDGREFLYISRVQIQRLQNSLKTKIQELIKKYL